jgi:hypothetical protein
MKTRPLLKTPDMPLFDPRDAFGDHNDPKTKRFLAKYSTRKREGVADDITGMVRRENPSTSTAAAKIIVRGVSDLQRRVLEAFTQHGPMTDEELELLPQFSHYGQTTVRKRRTELYQANKLERYSTKPNSAGVGMIVWNIPPGVTP